MVFKYFLQTNVIKRSCYCTSTNKVYSSTVLLPKTQFPLRLENNKLIERDKRVNSVS